MSSLIHSFYVCVVSFSIVISSREEGRAGCVVVSLFRNVYNVYHYLFSHPYGAMIYACGSSCLHFLLFLNYFPFNLAT